jgi:hypothetical protein
MRTLAYFFILYRKLYVMKKTFFALFAALFSTMVALAQGNGGGKDIDVNINTKGDSAWYASPWVWVVGAAVFILLLVALTRGNSRRAD